MNKTPVILVVDDNAELLWSYSRLLESSGYQVLQASTGEECLRLVNEIHPDLILLDVVLPDANGVELCKRIKAPSAFGGIFVALISAKDISSDEQAAGLEAGADQYIARPIDNRELLARVQALIRIKTAEEALRRSEQQFRLLSACSPVGIFLTDTEGRCTYTNPRCQEICGFTFEESLGEGWARFLHTEDRERVFNNWTEHARQGREYSEEHRFVTSQEDIRHVRVRSAHMLSDTGELIGQVGTVEDITEQKRVEDEIRFQANLLDMVGQAIVATDWNGRIVYWNRFAVKLYGWQSAEVIGRNIIDVTPSEASTEEAIVIMSRLRAGESYSGEFLVRRRDGTVFPAMTTVTPIRNTEGELIGIVGVSIDISERIKLERELREREAALAQSEERYRSLVQATSAIVWNTPASGEFEAEQPGWSAFTSQTFDELKGTGWLDAVHPDDRAHTMRTWEEALATRSLYEAQHRLRRHDGEYRHMLARAIPIIKSDGTVHEWVGVHTDLTEQYRLQEQLNAERIRLRDIFMQAPAFIATLRGPQHVFESANPQYFKLVGNRDNIGKPVREALPEVEGQGYYELLDQVYNTGEPFVGTEMSIHLQAEGSGETEERYVNFVYQPLKEPGGSVSGIFLHGVDVTEQVRARKRVEELAKINRTMTDNAASCLFMMDNQGYPTFMNPAAETVTGYVLDEIKDKPLHYAIHHTHPDGSPYPMSECPIKNASESMLSVREQEEVFVRKDGSFFPVSFSVAPLEREGKTVGAVLEFRDTTEQKRSEEALRFQAAASTLLFSSLEYETTLAAVARLAVPGFADWCVVDIAQDDGSIKRLAIAHVDPQKAELAYTLQNKFPPGAGRVRPVQDVLRSGISQLMPEVTDSLLAAIAKDDNHLGILRGLGLKSWIIVPLVTRGRTLGAITFMLGDSGRRYGNSDLALFEDLASRAAIAVDNAKLYRQAQEASRAKDEFLATVSHELRTPLNAIMGWAQILRRGGGNEQFMMRAIETIERNAKSQAQIINDILDVSRIITGKLRLEVRPVEPASVIQAAVETVRPAAEAKDIRIQMVLDSGAGLVPGDPDRLQQVVWNLLSNAIKFTPKGERVQVRLERVDSHVEIVVSDTGKGISPELLPYVFERFRQDDSSTTRQYGGIGLGLAIVRHLVELHGGTVYAHSEGEGKGSSFTVVLPIMPGQIRSSDHEADYAKQNESLSIHSLPVLDGLRVLIVDDEADARVLLKEMLAPCGAEIIDCASAAEALEAIKHSKPDIIVSDIGMPVEDGYTLIRKVRALAPEAEGMIPAIALTAYARSEDRIRALVAGYQAHVPKPVDLTELAAVIASLVGRTGKL
jgi:PAS domain S-box-containing protein